MLNPDHKAAPLGSGPGAQQIAVNEVRDWSSFANHNHRNRRTGKDETLIRGQRFPTVSVESFHDGIHGLIGTGDGSNGIGHMGNPQVAAVSA